MKKGKRSTESAVPGRNRKKKGIKKIAGKIYNEIVCDFHMPKALAVFQSLLEGPGLFKESESEDYG